MNDAPSALWGILILIASLIYIGSHRYRVAHAWKKGIRALEKGDLETARKSLGRCVKQSPSSATARRLLGRTLVALNQFEEAERHIRLAAQLEPRNPEGYLELAVFLSNCPPFRLDEAAESLGKAVELAPRLRENLDRIPQLAPLRDHPAFRRLLQTPPATP